MRGPWRAFEERSRRRNDDECIARRGLDPLAGPRPRNGDGLMRSANSNRNGEVGGFAADGWGSRRCVPPKRLDRQALEVGVLGDGVLEGADVRLTWRMGAVTMEDCGNN
jgi:hypothetical protein